MTVGAQTVMTKVICSIHMTGTNGNRVSGSDGSLMDRTNGSSGSDDQSDWWKTYD